MNVKKFVKRQNDLFISSFERVNQYRKDWNNLEERISNEYAPLMAELKESFLFEFFYLQSTKDLPSKTETENQNLVQFYMGGHPVGVIQTTREEGKFSSSFVIERGGALTFSQGPQGEVLVILYPCLSDVFKYHDDFIVYKVYSNPNKLQRKQLQRIIRFYFTFVYTTSYISKPSVWYRMHIAWIKHRHRIDLAALGKGLLSVISNLAKIKSGTKVAG